MSWFPTCSGRNAVKALAKLGYRVDHQHRRLTIPDHHELAKGTLRAIIRDAGLSVEEFRDLL